MAMNDPLLTIEKALVLIQDQVQREAAQESLQSLLKPLLVGQAIVAAVDQGKIPQEFIEGWVEAFLARRS